MSSIVWLFSGCGGEKFPPGMPKLYPATITVIQDGKPLDGAGVILLNVDPSALWSVGGITDKDGTVKLRTEGRYNGAPLGKYKVSVEKMETPDITMPGEPSNREEEKEYNRILKEMADKTFYVVDRKYALGVSELEVEITPTNLKLEVNVGPAVRIKLPTGSGG